VIALLSETAYVEYGSAPPFYLGPCSSVLEARSGNVASSCSVFAVVATLYGDGRVVLTDLSAAVTVQAVSNCVAAADGSGSASCSTCPLELLHLPGRCPPGTYHYR
jgi:hypothetical protein